MGFSLTEAFSQEFEKEKLGTNALAVPCFSTGIDLLDYHNGKKNFIGEDGDYWLSTGIDGGTFIMVIGPSHSGKSTLALQIAKNIVKKYDESQIIYEDIENGLTMPRVRGITRWSSDVIKKKFIHHNVDITTENIFKKMEIISQLKLDHYDDLKITLDDQFDNEGNPIECLPPTVIIIDSLAVMMPEKIMDDDELSNNMYAANIAKQNGIILKKNIQKLRKANIILIGINHITQNIETNPMMHSKPSLNYLKQGK